MRVLNIQMRVTVLDLPVFMYVCVYITSISCETNGKKAKVFQWKFFVDIVSLFLFCFPISVYLYFSFKFSMIMAFLSDWNNMSRNNVSVRNSAHTHTLLNSYFYGSIIARNVRWATTYKSKEKKKKPQQWARGWFKTKKQWASSLTTMMPWGPVFQPRKKNYSRKFSNPNKTWKLNKV